MDRMLEVFEMNSFECVDKWEQFMMNSNYELWTYTMICDYILF